MDGLYTFACFSDNNNESQLSVVKIDLHMLAPPDRHRSPPERSEYACICFHIPYGRAYKPTRLTSQPDLQVNQTYKSNRLTSQPDIQVKQAYKSTRLTSQKQVTMIYENKRAMCSNSIYNKQR